MMRLVNDETEAPNVHLMYWPEERKDPPRLPRRCFLVAKRDVPPLTELTWDYGKQYRRPWLVEEASDEGSDTDDDEEWTEINWACCDNCDKVR